MEKIAARFYDAFAKLDWQTMNSLYAESAKFSDPIFQNLSTKEARAMWKMLCTTAKEFSLTSEVAESNREFVSVNWQANYVFSRTGRTVTNRVQSKLKIRDDKIVEHIDQFDLHKWAGQALGPIGFLLGWVPPFQAKLRDYARGNLQKFLK